MNDLNDTITNYLHIKELLQSYKKNDKFLDCIVTLLDHYIDTQDQTFKVAWNETVSKLDPNKSDQCEKETPIPNTEVKKWPVSVQEIENGDTGQIEHFIELPDDLLEQVGWKETDQIDWIDNKDGTFTLKKLSKSYQEMIADGWTMTADGFWIRE
jgi:hypothetical protein